jgi:hypothetical protein
MAKYTLDAILSHYTAGTTRESNVGDKDIDQASAVMPASTIPPERRCEPRMEYRSMCSCKLLEAIEGESVLIEQGVAFTLNRSTEGMLLLMGQAPLAKQLIEVYTPRSRWSRTANVFEARWTRPVQLVHNDICTWLNCRRHSTPSHCRSNIPSRLTVDLPVRNTAPPTRRLPLLIQRG